MKKHMLLILGECRGTFATPLRKKPPKVTSKMTPKFKDNFGSSNSVDPQTANPQTGLTFKRFWFPNLNRETLNRCQPRNRIDPYAILTPKQALHSVIHCEYWKYIVYVNYWFSVLVVNNGMQSRLTPKRIAYHVRIVHTKHQKRVFATSHL